ncbi:MAG: alginate export family protein [Ignavibacteria bacterium]|nr:alginate export family protein [Ignavibacteria bacterium]
MFLIFSSLFFIFSLNQIYCQDDFKIFGEFRVRTELDGRDFLNKTYPQSFTSMRTRLGVSKTLFEKIQIFIQLQDSRVFGEEKSTLESIKNIDLHQGFLTLKDIFDSKFYLTVGRFKLNYGSFKIFGPNDWHNVGRSFDGFKLGYDSDFLRADAFVTTISNFLNFRSGAAPIRANYNYNEAPPDTSFNLYGLYSTINPGNFYKIDIYGYYELDRARILDTSTRISYSRTKRFTFGGVFNFVPNQFPLFARVELAYQGGEIFTNSLKKISAFTIFANLGYKFGDLNISLNADIHSGGDPSKSDKYQLFENAFASKHNFQGFMDYFTRLASPDFKTGIYGLNDYFLRILYSFNKSLFIHLDAHYFTSFVQFKSTDNKDIFVYGPELDLVVRYNLLNSVDIEWGSGLFIPQEAMKEVFITSLPNRDRKAPFDPAFWTYLQFNVRF